MAEKQEIKNSDQENQTDATSQETTEVKRQQYTEQEKVAIFDNEFLPQIDSYVQLCVSPHIR